MHSGTRLPVPLLPRWLRWGGVAVVAGFIFYTSLLTVPPATPVDPVKPSVLPLDKWRHFVAYAVLTGTLAYASADWNASVGRIAAFVLGGSILFGVGIELGQAPLPARYFSVEDAYANVLGAVVATPWFLVRSRVEFVDARTWVRTLVASSD